MCIGDRPEHAFLWFDGVMYDLGTLGGTYSHANAVNEWGQIVGQASIPGGRQHAFLWEKGQMYDLGTPASINSEALAINNLGEVVGWASRTGFGGRFATLWRHGQMLDLHEVLPKGVAWQLSEANGINDRGQIVVTGYARDRTSAFLLTPVRFAQPVWPQSYPSPRR